MLQRLKTALEMTEGREELTRKEMTELKWAIYFVNCYPENSSAIDETLDIVRGNWDETIKIDHNDPSKPSHCLINGTEPSKTIESDGNKIKNH